MTVMVTAFMPIAIPVAVAPIFPRVTMLSASVFAGGVTLTTVLVADGLAALFADLIAKVLSILDASLVIVLSILDAGRAIVLPILDAGLMLIPGGLVIRLILMTLLLTRIGMRII
jgi:hypothetical protein